MKNYLFSFTFEKNTMNTYITSWLRSKDIHYFYHMQQIYADIYNIGEYYYIDIVDMPGAKKEVYAITDKVITEPAEGKEKALLTNDYENIYRIKAIYNNGDYTITRINGNFESIKSYYIGSSFSEDPEKIITSVEFLETIK